MSSSKQPAVSMARKDTATVFQRHFTLCDILQNTDNNLNQNTYLVKFKTVSIKKKSNLKKTKKINTCFHICLEGKK